MRTSTSSISTTGSVLSELFELLQDNLWKSHFVRSQRGVASLLALFPLLNEEENALHISICMLLWKCLQGSLSARSQFRDANGVEKVLDMLGSAKTPSLSRIALLGCLQSAFLEMDMIMDVWNDRNGGRVLCSVLEESISQAEYDVVIQVLLAFKNACWGCPNVAEQLGDRLIPVLVRIFEDPLSPTDVLVHGSILVRFLLCSPKNRILFKEENGLNVIKQLRTNENAEVRVAVDFSLWTNIGERVVWSSSTVRGLSDSLQFEDNGYFVLCDRSLDTTYVRGVEPNPAYFEIEGVDQGRGIRGCSIKVGIVSLDQFHSSVPPFSSSNFFRNPFHQGFDEPRCNLGDTFGVGLDFARGRILFFRNRRCIGVEHGLSKSVDWYPCLSSFTRPIGIRSLDVAEVPDFETISWPLDRNPDS